MKHKLVDELIDIFKNNIDRYQAHEKSKPILEKMSNSTAFLYDIIRSNLLDPFFLIKSRHYSTLSMTIFENSDFSFVVNIFPPLPDRRTDVSFQSIHHHGSLLLSSVAAFGPGYNCILFKKGFTIDYTTCITKMEIDKDYQNQLHQVGFVDSDQPHIVFYPSDFSATFALWSDQKKTSKQVLKKIGFIRRFKKPLLKIAQAIGLDKKLGVNKIAFFDFYPVGKNIIAMKDRDAYNEEGSNDNFLQNIFCFIQKTGFHDIVFLNEVMSNDKTPESAIKFIQMIINGVTINDSFISGHLNVPKVNLIKNDIINAFTNG